VYFLFSGEGAQDLGMCSGGASACEGPQYEHGPMTVIVDHLAHGELGYSLLERQDYGFLSEGHLTRLTRELKPAKRSPRLRGKKRAKETMYFYRNARALALYARDKAAHLSDDVVAVLFRDSDGSASAGRGNWRTKRQSMIAGFRDADFDSGVPMIPKPKSEAWLLCALKANPYQGCAALERDSGNDRSPKSLKRKLKKRLGRSPSREILCEMVNDGTVDVDRIDMPSFDAFKTRLKEVFRSAGPN